jgi:hypothetical protein
MSVDVSTAPATHDTAAFTKWIGMDTEVAEPVEDAAEDAEDTTDDPLEVAAEATEALESVKDAEAEDDEPDPEPIKLPFAASAKDEAVDTALLADMQVTFKADGKDVTLALADVVRRAQSEPAVQRQLRAVSEDMKQVQQLKQQLEAEVAEVRSVALKMARDPNYYADVVGQIEQYDMPEARAQRLEAELAARTEREQQASREADRNAVVQQFAVTEVAPALDDIVSRNPLVTEEEILGKFFADTARITVNGVIPPEYHQSLAQYLRTDLAAFAASRQSEYTARESKVKAEALKTQRERQKLKNQSAQAAKPMGGTGAMRDTPVATRPRTAKEAENGALAALMNGL